MAEFLRTEAEKVRRAVAQETLDERKSRVDVIRLRHPRGGPGCSPASLSVEVALTIKMGMAANLGFKSRLTRRAPVRLLATSYLNGDAQILRGLDRKLKSVPASRRRPESQVG
jgi:hypothetical protein